MSVTDLTDYRRQRDIALTVAPVNVEREADAMFPNRSYYVISSAKSAAVQGYINSLVAECELFGNGYGYVHFIGPRWHSSGVYFAFGEVVVNPDQEASA